jgi:hypothetical protein
MGKHIMTDDEFRELFNLVETKYIPLNEMQHLHDRLKWPNFEWDWVIEFLRKKPYLATLA